MINGRPPKWLAVLCGAERTAPHPSSWVPLPLDGEKEHGKGNPFSHHSQPFQTRTSTQTSLWCQPGDAAQIPKRLEGAYQYRPDHFVLRLRKHGERYRLIVDFQLFMTLRKVQKGLPRHLLPERDLNRLDSFLTQLHEADPQKADEFIVYNQETLATSRVQVSEDHSQYLRVTLAI